MQPVEMYQQHRDIYRVYSPENRQAIEHLRLFISSRYRVVTLDIRAVISLCAAPQHILVLRFPRSHRMLRHGSA